MRLFLAVPISAAAATTLASQLAAFRTAAPETRWEAPEALHLTLKFIGAWPPADLDRLIAALASHAWPALTLHLAGLGAFPAPSRPRTLWAAAEPTALLRRWALQIERLLTPLGIPTEPRAFQPHITLARLRSPADLADLKLRFDPHQPRWGDCPANGMTLFETVPGALPASRYQPRHHFPAR